MLFDKPIQDSTDLDRYKKRWVEEKLMVQSDLVKISADCVCWRYTTEAVTEFGVDFYCSQKPIQHPKLPANRTGSVKSFHWQAVAFALKL
jgi:hypothetical protein